MPPEEDLAEFEPVIRFRRETPIVPTVDLANGGHNDGCSMLIWSRRRDG